MKVQETHDSPGVRVDAYFSTPVTPLIQSAIMCKAEILAELPKLSVEDRAEIRAKLDELAGRVWLDDGELSEEDKRALEEAIAEYEKDPDAGSPWEEVRIRLEAELRGDKSENELGGR